MGKEGRIQTKNVFCSRQAVTDVSRELTFPSPVATDSPVSFGPVEDLLPCERPKTPNPLIYRFGTRSKDVLEGDEEDPRPHRRCPESPVGPKGQTPAGGPTTGDSTGSVGRNGPDYDSRQTTDDSLSLSRGATDSPPSDHSGPVRPSTSRSGSSWNFGEPGHLYTRDRRWTGYQDTPSRHARGGKVYETRTPQSVNRPRVK